MYNISLVYISYLKILQQCKIIERVFFKIFIFFDKKKTSTSIKYLSTKSHII